MAKFIAPKAVHTTLAAATPLEGEIIYDKDQKKILYGDGAHQGGVELGTAHVPYVYGYCRDTTKTDDTAYSAVVLNADGATYTTVSNFTKMPCHAYRNCVMDNLSTRHVNYYLSASDIRKKADGSAATLTGADGDVMQEWPVSYYRIDYIAAQNLEIFWMSTEEFLNSSVWAGFYVGPGGATARVQYTGRYEGYVDGDGKLRSISGVVPTTSKTRASFESAAVLNGGQIVNDLMNQWYGHLLVCQRLSNNSQALSAGLTNLTGTWSDSWKRTTGRCDALPVSGEVLADETAGTGLDLDLVSSWNSNAAANGGKVVSCVCLGREQPWGEIWELSGGFQKYQTGVADDYTESGYHFTTDTSKYSVIDGSTALSPGSPNTPFPAAGCTPGTTAWVSHPWPKDAGYVKKYDARTFFAKELGGTSTTGLCDYLYNAAAAGARVGFRGGRASDGSLAGFFYVYVTESLGYSYGYLGARLAA